MFLGARVTRAEDLEENENKKWSFFVCVCDLDRDKISIRYFRFLPGFRKYCVFVMVARQEMGPKSSFWKKWKDCFCSTNQFCEPLGKAPVSFLKRRCGFVGDFCTKLSQLSAGYIFLFGSRYDPVNWTRLLVHPRAEINWLQMSSTGPTAPRRRAVSDTPMPQRKPPPWNQQNLDEEEESILPNRQMPTTQLPDEEEDHIGSKV